MIRSRQRKVIEILLKTLSILLFCQQNNSSLIKSLIFLTSQYLYLTIVGENGRSPSNFGRRGIRYTSTVNRTYDTTCSTLSSLVVIHPTLLTPVVISIFHHGTLSVLIRCNPGNYGMILGWNPAR
jgi:hypothetical protein